ncbi:hypothetical protein [Streptomyces sp. GQFP]|uniref:hypothetical protein n=1 Tax=Streptomyces sp. GQFP TaxID=2907545 RepID=UPI001F2A92D8|nr:hypothetical protein [Streptomyces sp. GQFP]UIX30763.1 hypothetical protein LUX31_12385 [Streptomyces sp. GQFP]
MKQTVRHLSGKREAPHPLLHVIRVTLTEADKPLALEEFHLPGDDLELSFRL